MKYAMPLPVHHAKFIVLAACCLAGIGWNASPCVGQEDLRLLQTQAIREAVDQVAASVVRIETFGGLERVDEVLVGTGPTTGLIVSEDGYVLSSAFNFIQLPTSILVTLPDGKRQAAQIVARDQSRMLVLLKVNADSPLPVPTTASRDEIAVGQTAIALGRTFPSAHPNLSVGIVSAGNRIWGRAIQTDAKISPSNYGGPLIDLEGRVLGILVPMSPQGSSEVAGTEWYDSGIGFAVPLVDLLPHLDKMKAGQDLQPGILGISIKGGNVYADPPLVAACQVKSPAYEAGIRVGDLIVEVNGRAVRRHSELKHALGPLYAGDLTTVVVERGDEKQRQTFQCVLTDQLEPYVHPFLGILPLRVVDDAAGGVVVRYVYPDSPAAGAGLEAGDRITHLNDQPVPNAVNLREQMAAFEPGGEVSLAVSRNNETQKLAVVFGQIPTTILLESLPPARAATEGADPPPVSGVVEIKIPEEPNNCLAYVPTTYRETIPHGLVVWLHAPGQYDQEQLVARWKDLCEKHELILLAPQSQDPRRWVPTERDFVQKAIEDALNRFSIDRTRIVVHGYQAGGSMAYLVTFSNRELVRGVAAVDAPVTRRAQAISNEPLQPLAIYSAVAKQSQVADAVEAGEDQLSELKFPVTSIRLEGASRYLNDEEVARLARWIDVLDRL